MKNMGKAEKLSHFDNKVRKSLAKVLPPHTFTKVYSKGRTPMLELLAEERPDSKTFYHKVNFNDLNFSNDLGNAAGFDKDGELLAFNYQMGAGFGLVGTVLNEPHKGNVDNSLGLNPWVPLPFSNGAINSLGLPSKGVEEVVKNINNFRKEHHSKLFPIGASIMGHPLQKGEEKLNGTVNCLRRLLYDVDFVEINESCPNVKHNEDGEALEYRLTRILNARNVHRGETGTKVPIFVKLANFGDVEHTIKFMTDMGVDGLVGVNTQKNYDEFRNVIDKRDLKNFDYYTSEHKGGISGKPIKGFAYNQINAAADEIKRQNSPLKLVHVGGIKTHEDIQKSREIEDPVILREWYNGMLENMANMPFNEVYKSVLNGN